MSEHTPGPWIVELTPDWYEVSDGLSTICRLDKYEWAEHDANLIAASTELLQELEASDTLIGALLYIIRHGLKIDTLKSELRQVERNAAIAKAKGESK